MVAFTSRMAALTSRMAALVGSMVVALVGNVVAFVRWWLRPRRLVLLAVAGTALTGAVLAGSLLWVRSASAAHLYPPGAAPHRPVAIVFGSQVYADGTPSPVFADRLAAALQLYRDGKVRAILVTGDNGQVEYNEVNPARQWLIERGVPAGKVVGDYAGFDTYSSCVRAVRIFGVRDAVLVTQSFHLSRAVALCRRVGMDAIGVPASHAGLDPATLRRLALRDKLASVKAAGEMLFQPDPRYLGRRETGVEDALSGH